jgi:hypothetical protein
LAEEDTVAKNYADISSDTSDYTTLITDHKLLELIVGKEQSKQKKSKMTQNWKKVVLDEITFN